jgi:hypothetical protein
MASRSHYDLELRARGVAGEIGRIDAMKAPCRFTSVVVRYLFFDLFASASTIILVTVTVWTASPP